MSKVVIEMLPALHGDCFLIGLGTTPKFNILIDTGLRETYYKYLRNRLLEIAKGNGKIDLMVITHIDEDHIEGGIEFFSENGISNEPRIIDIKEVWHNSYRHLQFKGKHSLIGLKERFILDGIVASIPSKKIDNENSDISARQGSTLASYLFSGKYPWNSHFASNAVNADLVDIVQLDENVVLRILSPNSEKLSELGGLWKKELNKKKYGFTFSDESIFDDAFEFFMKESPDTLMITEDDNISSKVIYLDQLLLRQVTPDMSPTNGSSISLIIEYEGRKLLFLGDSHPDVIYNKLMHLVKTEGYSCQFDLIKVSHHGSKKNSSDELLSIIDAPNYLISTNGMKHNHPDLEALAKIICRKSDFTRNIFFNYPVENAKLIENLLTSSNYNFILNIPDSETPINIEL